MITINRNLFALTLLVVCSTSSPCFSNEVHIIRVGTERAAAKQTDQNTSQTKLECTPASLAADNVPIKSFRVPPGWVQTRRSSKWAFGGNTGYNYEFAPESRHAEAGLFIDWDGRTIAENYRAEWRDIFSKPPHQLDQGEIVFLDEVIKLNHADANYYKLNSARTVDWNGRMVVETDAQTVSVDDPVFHSIAITFDNYGDLTSAGVIRYSATPELFDKYMGEAMKSMKKIQWREKIISQ